MRVLTVLLRLLRLLLLLTLLFQAVTVRAQHQLNEGDFESRLFIALRQRLVGLMCVWESRCMTRATTTCLREAQEASRLVVTLTQCYAVVPGTMHVTSRTDRRLVALRVQQLKQCLRDRNDKAGVFIECVARG